jgi:biotin transport system substrate-specific component
MRESRTRSVVLCGLSIAMLAVGAFIVLPFGMVPFTLQTLVLILVVLILKPKEAMAAVGGYLLLGSLGMPIFAGMRGGLGALAGPSGGFLVGFLLGTVIIVVVGTLMHKDEKPSLVFDIATAITIMLASYICGTAWYCIAFGVSVSAALVACVIPFLVPDIVKAAAAVLGARPVRKALGR